MSTLTVLLGGQKSGKSSAAARLAEATGSPVVVIAPAEAGDGEFADRIARHRADRPGAWSVVESFEVAAGLAQVPDDACVIVDALDTWLLHVMDVHGALRADDDLRAPDADVWDRVLAEITALVPAARSRRGDTLVIAGVPGLGPIGATPLVRHYADLHGLAVRRLADAADRTLFVVAGRAIDLDRLDVLPGS